MEIIYAIVVMFHLGGSETYHFHDGWGPLITETEEECIEGAQRVAEQLRLIPMDENAEVRCLELTQDAYDTIYDGYFEQILGSDI